MTEHKAEIIRNINTFTDDEKAFFIITKQYGTGSLCEFIKDKNYFDGWGGYSIERFYKNSLFGRQFKNKMRHARKVFKGDLLRLKKVLSVMSNSRRVSSWGRMNAVGHLQKAINDNSLTIGKIASFLHKIRHNKEMTAIFDGYINDPIFNVGQITQLRSNIGVDAILDQDTRSSNYYGIRRSELSKAKKKTFIIIGIEPKLDGLSYGINYSYKAKQGGCRLYKVLPVGETKTYYVVEKFLKKCRTKAVKDALK